MKYIPVASLSAIVDLTVAIGAAAIIFSRRRLMGKSDALVPNFMRAFIFMGCGFFLFSLAGIVIFDLRLIEVSYIFGNAFFLIAMRYLISIPVRIFAKEDRLTKVMSWVLVVSAIFHIIFNLIFLKPAEAVYFKPFIDWRDSAPPALQLIVWALVAATLLGITLLFIIHGWYHDDRLIRKRSRIYACGFFLDFIGWLSIFLFAISAIKSPVILVGGGALGCFLISAGMILLLIASISKSISVLGSE